MRAPVTSTCGRSSRRLGLPASFPTVTLHVQKMLLAPRTLSVSCLLLRGLGSLGKRCQDCPGIRGSVSPGSKKPGGTTEATWCRAPRARDAGRVGPRLWVPGDQNLPDSRLRCKLRLLLGQVGAAPASPGDAGSVAVCPPRRLAVTGRAPGPRPEHNAFPPGALCAEGQLLAGNAAPRTRDWSGLPPGTTVSSRPSCGGEVACALKSQQGHS